MKANLNIKGLGNKLWELLSRVEVILCDLLHGIAIRHFLDVLVLQGNGLLVHAMFLYPIRPNAIIDFYGQKNYIFKLENTKHVIEWRSFV
uniref:Uncharacterized protein n=1 Tax=Lactuca sativa TaxID=4236 RepID=A0A9R1XV51_LACSA|nr:hypothetical protein LSAT_V11C200051320 [Lactuca sativa]